MTGAVAYSPKQHVELSQKGTAVPRNGLFFTEKNVILVGGFEHVLFFHILGIIIPTDFHTFQRARSTTN
jgi:hypothetical protein